MRPCSAAQAALLASPPPGLKSADLFTFTLRDGVTTYRWTSYDTDLLVSGNVYSSRKPWIQRSRWSVANTMAVPTLEVSLFALNDGFAGGLDLKAQITNGLLDGATATLDRVCFAAGTTVVDDRVDAGTFTTVSVVDISSVSNCSQTLAGGLSVGITLSGFSPADVVRLTLAAGHTYTVWNSGAGYENSFDVIPDSNPVNSVRVSSSGSSPSSNIHFGDYTTAAAAQAGFGTQYLTGASTYTFYINDYPIFDNSGGVSVLVESASGTLRSYSGVRLFGGNIGNVDVVGNGATINIKGRTNLLDQYAPRNLYQLGCEHAFCDAGCTLSRSTFTTSHTVGASPTRTFVPWSGTPPASPSNFRFGTVTFTSGPCSGQARTVRSADSSGLTLTHPLTATPVAGNGFTTFEGCDKQLNSGSGQDCTARSNTQNWRAFPFVPPADTAF